jgi:hypothetical protein
MTPEERNIILNKFIDDLNSTPSRSTQRISDELADINIDESQLPKL